MISSLVYKDTNLILLSVLGGGCFLVWSFFYDVAFVGHVTNEDSYVENLTALFYVLGCALCIGAVFKNRFYFLPLMWFVLCFFFLGEEVSWFQRVFDYSVPAVEEMNSQGEFNFHNLNVIQSNNLFDGDRSFDWKKELFTAQNLFRLGFFGYFFVMPLFLMMFNVGFISRFMAKVNYHRPDALFVFGVFGLFLLSFIVIFLLDAVRKPMIAEIREMLYAFFISLYLFIYVFKKEVV